MYDNLLLEVKVDFVKLFEVFLDSFFVLLVEATLVAVERILAVLVRAREVAQPQLASKLPNLLLVWVDVRLLHEQLLAQMGAILHVPHLCDFGDGSHLLLERLTDAPLVALFVRHLVLRCFFQPLVPVPSHVLQI